MLSVTVSSLMQLAVMANPAPAATYDDAYRQAVDTGRPLVVLVGADWCPGCINMKNNVIPQLAGDGSLGKVSFATVNVDNDRSTADKLMSGGTIPQLIMYHKSASGWRRTQLTGPQSASTVTAMFNQGVRESAPSVAARIEYPTSN